MIKANIAFGVNQLLSQWKTNGFFLFTLYSKHFEQTFYLTYLCYFQLHYHACQTSHL